MDDDSLLQSALDAAGRGFRVVPLHAVGADGACSCSPACSKAGKHPRVMTWLDLATTDTAAIERWWTLWPDANVGIATGRSSGIVVIDVDPRNGGDVALRVIHDEFELPLTLTAETGGGGRHLYFAYPGELLVRDLPALAPWKGQGIDIQGEKKLVVAPGSRHASGNSYRWMTDDTVADLPGALLARLPRDHRVRPAGIGDYVWKMLVDETNQVRETETNRNDALNRAAFRIGGVVDDLGDDVAREALVDAGRAAGLPLHEVQSTVTSGLRAGALHPRNVAVAYSCRQDALADLAEILTTFRSRPWTGSHRDKRMMRVFEGLAKLATATGGPKDFTAGTRRIGIESKVGGLTTVTRALLELRVEGWVVREWMGTNGRSSRWSLTVPRDVVRCCTPDTTPPTGVATFSVRNTDPSEPTVLHDAFREQVVDRAYLGDDGQILAVPRGLGYTAGRIWQFLLDQIEPLRPADVARALTVHRSTAGRNLAQLLEYGLVRPEGAGYVGVEASADDLVDIAKARGVHDVAEDQRHRYGWTKTG